MLSAETNGALSAEVRHQKIWLSHFYSNKNEESARALLTFESIMWAFPQQSHPCPSPPPESVYMHFSLLSL